MRGGQRGQIEESEPAEAVIERHHDHAMLRQLHAVIDRHCRSTAAERAAIDPHHHRQFRSRRSVGRPDIQRKAVLAFGKFLIRHALGPRRLHANWAELARIAHAAPIGRGLRCAPAQIADGRRGEGNVLEDGNAAIGRAGKRALRDCHLRAGKGRARNQNRKCCHPCETAHRPLRNCPCIREAFRPVPSSQMLICVPSSTTRFAGRR